MNPSNLIREKRFEHITKFEPKLPFSSPVLYGDEQEYVARAFELGQLSTEGENLDKLEETAARYIGVKYAIALNSGAAALHLALKLAAERLYRSSSGISTPDGLGCGGCLKGRRVFCSDLTASSSVDPILYEGGEPIFIDASVEDWNMDPEALETAFEYFPEVKLVVYTHLYGFPGQMDEIQRICRNHGALLIENAAEALGARYKGKRAGSFGDYGILSFGEDKIITGEGGMLLVNDRYSAEKARRWIGQSIECTMWNQQEELQYSYRMGNVTAGIIRGQWKHIGEYIERKKAIYTKYAEALEGLDVQMNPYNSQYSEPYFCIPCRVIGENSLCEYQRSETGYVYDTSHGCTCPDEILDALRAFHAEGRPVWKPMHMQPMYRNHEFVSVDGCRRSFQEFYIKMLVMADEGEYVFRNGVCLPGSLRMTDEELEWVIEIIVGCYQ